MQRQRGFTLLEIMVVIVILGILASLVVPNLMGNKEKADRQKVVSDLVALEGALDMYKLDNSRYPNTEQGLQALVTAPAAEPRPALPSAILRGSHAGSLLEAPATTRKAAISAVCRRTRGGMSISC